MQITTVEAGVDGEERVGDSDKLRREDRIFRQAFGEERIGYSDKLLEKRGLDIQTGFWRREGWIFRQA